MSLADNVECQRIETNGLVNKSHFAKVSERLVWDKVRSCDMRARACLICAIDTYLFERELMSLHIGISLTCSGLYMTGSIYHICDTSVSTTSINTIKFTL